MMSSTRWARLLALLLAVGLIAAACGDSDDDGDGGDDGATTTAAADDDGGDDATDDTEAPDDGGDDATDDTEAPDDGDDGGGDGGDDDMAGALPTEGQVEVAAGTTLDLDECPDDWSPTAGITDDTITLAMSLPQSGQAAIFGTIGEGMVAYFDWINENDPVDGKEIELILRDDAYEAGRTVANVEEILETDQPFAIVYPIGSPNSGAIRPITDEECVPQLFNSTGLPAWGDPANWPWTIGGLLSYETEANIWCENIVDELGEGATVAGLFMNNDFGASYQATVEGCADAGQIDLVANEVHEATAPDITNEMTNMIASDADAFVFGSTAAFCPQSVGALAQSAWRPVFYMSNTCQTLAAYFAPVQEAAALLASEGSAVRVANTSKSFTDPAYADNEAVLEGIEILEAAGIDHTAGQGSIGIIFGYSVVDLLRNTLENYGELNRVTVMGEVWNLDSTNPYLLDGATVQTDGVNDAYTTEAARLDQVVEVDGQLTYEPVTEVIDLEGQTGSVGG